MSKLNLDDLKVQSFVTTIDPKEQAAMYGMVETGPRVCGTGPRTCGGDTNDYACTIEQTQQYCYDTEQIFGCSGGTGFLCGTAWYECAV